MNKSLRAKRILEILEKRQSCSAADLQRELDVSAPTIYRDLRDLEERGLVVTARGAVQLPGEPLRQDESANTRFYLRLNRRRQEKNEIAAKAARLVHDDDIVFADSSTTAFYFVKTLMAQHQRLSNLTLITNSAAMLRELVDPPPTVTLICLGGVYNAALNGFLGRMTLQTLQQLHITQAFVSAAAVSTAEVYTYHEHHAEFLGEVLRHADKSHLLVDHAKFETKAVFPIARTSSFASIVADDALDPSVAAKYKAAGLAIA